MTAHRPAAKRFRRAVWTPRSVVRATRNSRRQRRPQLALAPECAALRPARALQLQLMAAHDARARPRSRPAAPAARRCARCRTRAPLAAQWNAQLGSRQLHRQKAALTRVAKRAFALRLLACAPTTRELHRLKLTLAGYDPGSGKRHARIASSKQSIFSEAACESAAAPAANTEPPGATYAVTI
jgi:hypothetical protein